MARIGQNQRQRLCFVQYARWWHHLYIRLYCLVEFARWRQRGGRSVISDYIFYHWDM